VDATVSYLVNCIFAWIIVLLSIAGYFLTIRRIGEKWIFWVVLATGWAFFAIVNTVLVAGASPGSPFLIAVWLSSYVLVIVSLVLLFVQLIKINR